MTCYVINISTDFKHPYLKIIFLMRVFINKNGTFKCIYTVTPFLCYSTVALLINRYTITKGTCNEIKK